eukprot:1155993-Pelagomonas_calceolata.AAC.14
MVACVLWHCGWKWQVLPVCGRGHGQERVGWKETCPVTSWSNKAKLACIAPHVSTIGTQAVSDPCSSEAYLFQRGRARTSAHSLVLNSLGNYAMDLTKAHFCMYLAGRSPPQSKCDP